MITTSNIAIRRHHAMPKEVSVNIISNMCCSIELMSAAPVIALAMSSMLTADSARPMAAALVVSRTNFLPKGDERSGLAQRMQLKQRQAKDKHQVQIQRKAHQNGHPVHYLLTSP
jgi:hypothetical protein